MTDKKIIINNLSGGIAVKKSPKKRSKEQSLSYKRYLEKNPKKQNNIRSPKKREEPKIVVVKKNNVVKKEVSPSNKDISRYAAAC